MNTCRLQDWTQTPPDRPLRPPPHKGFSECSCSHKSAIIGTYVARRRRKFLGFDVQNTAENTSNFHSNRVNINGILHKKTLSITQNVKIFRLRRASILRAPTIIGSSTCTGICPEISGVCDGRDFRLCQWGKSGSFNHNPILVRFYFRSEYFRSAYFRPA